MSDHPVLVTGAAGFIGFCLARRLLEGGRAVVGIDSLNSYYDPALKAARLKELAASMRATPNLILYHTTYSLCRAGLHIESKPTPNASWPHGGTC